MRYNLSRALCSGLHAFLNSLAINPCGNKSCEVRISGTDCIDKFFRRNDSALIELFSVICHGALFTHRTDHDFRSLFTTMLQEGTEFITIFYGQGVTEEQAEAASVPFRAACPDCELSLLPGGQPVYYYIVSME